MFGKSNKDGSVYVPLKEQDEFRSASEMEETYLSTVQKARRRHPLINAAIGLAVVTFIVLYSGLLIYGTSKLLKMDRRHGTRWLKSPVSEHIWYEPREFEQEERTAKMQYFQAPSPEVDQNWHNLFEHQNIRISEETMRDLGRLDEGIKLPNGDYYGSLMVFHHLHCLKNIYHAIHPEYYGLDNLSEDEQLKWDFHVEHCLHMIRDGVMCQADTTVLTMAWGVHGPLPIGNFTSPHECVNWDRLMEWVEPRSFDAFEDGMLVHPKFGPPFIDGKPANRPEGEHQH